MPSQKIHTQNSFKVNSSPPNHRPSDNLTGNKFPNNHPSIIQQCRQRIKLSRSGLGRGKFPPRRRASGTLLKRNQSTRRLVTSLFGIGRLGTATGKWKEMARERKEILNLSSPANSRCNYARGGRGTSKTEDPLSKFQGLRIIANILNRLVRLRNPPPSAPPLSPAQSSSSLPADSVESALSI